MQGSGGAAFLDGEPAPSSREEELRAEIADLTAALQEAAEEIRVWRRRSRTVDA